MTGEITLRGNVLPVGGVKEKLLAARRAKMKTVILPEPNRRDLEDLPQEVRRRFERLYLWRMCGRCSTAPSASAKPAAKAGSKGLSRLIAFGREWYVDAKVLAC